ncbi:MAG: EAL domain-containing protein [Desulfamplus sp.]|nr:EAL domain-containing protein [Desulfamplus sp.]
MSENKPCFDIKQISLLASEDDREWSGKYQKYDIYTAMQPIFSLSHKRVVGYEALMRVKDADNNWLNPADLFMSLKNQDDIILLDRLCRYIHTGNFVRLNASSNWLFLNVSPYVMLHGKDYGSFFNDLLRYFSIAPHQVVIEIVEDPVVDQSLIVETVMYYKNLGCLVAIDDFGRGESNFERVWDFQPQIVKLDRSMIVKASEQKRVRRLFPSIVSLIHQTGSLVLIEGIETEEQAIIAMESDADFVQGYFFAKPLRFIEMGVLPSPPFKQLFEKYRINALSDKKNNDKIRAVYTNLFHRTIELLVQGVNLKSACQDIMNTPSVLRCYLLMENGIQIESTIFADNNRTSDVRFKPLENAENADWCRREYLRKAVSQPDQLQISQPYFSITGAHICITLSFMFTTDSGSKVICCDLDADREDYNLLTDRSLI